MRQITKSKIDIIFITEMACREPLNLKPMPKTTSSRNILTNDHEYNLHIYLYLLSTI